MRGSNEQAERRRGGNRAGVRQQFAQQLSGGGQLKAAARRGNLQHVSSSSRSHEYPLLWLRSLVRAWLARFVMELAGRAWKWKWRWKWKWAGSARVWPPQPPQPPPPPPRLVVGLALQLAAASCVRWPPPGPLVALAAPICLSSNLSQPAYRRSPPIWPVSHGRRLMKTNRGHRRDEWGRRIPGRRPACLGRRLSPDAPFSRALVPLGRPHWYSGSACATCGGADGTVIVAAAGAAVRACGKVSANNET